VFARSPEAKGRIERACGTFQDRLVAELRLAGASTLEEANRVLWEFLPRFAARFGVPAAQPGSAYRPVAEGFDLDSVFCFKEWRRVARDNTVRYWGKTLQLFPGPDRPSYARARVEVQERLDGCILVSYQGKLRTPREAPPLAAELRTGVNTAPQHPCPGPEVTAGCADQTTEEPAPVREPQRRVIWHQDSAMMQRHRELVKAGMERARQQGRPIGRPRLVD